MPARAPQPDDAALDDLADLVTAMRPDELEQFAASLDPDDLAVVELAVARAHAMGWRTDPATMAAWLDPAYRTWRYVRLLSRKWVEAATGVSKRQIWSLPARYGKSQMVQWGVTWSMDRTQGRARFILASYGHALAVENAVGVRDRLKDHADVLHCQLRSDRGRMDRWVTDNGGGVVAAGIAGAIRGFGAGAGGGVVVDDPFKNWQEAHSENQRTLVWNSYRGTLLDRLDDEEAFVIVVHHRVHEDDLTGRLLADAEQGGEQWDHVKLPALAVAGDQLGRAPGEPLEPERFSVAFIEQTERGMGSYLFSALQQQEPAAEEGTDLLRSWFHLYETPPLAADQTVTSWDLKLKDRESGDFVVGQVWWRTGPDYWLRDQLRGQWDHATTANAIALLAVRHPEVRTHVVEAAGSADEVVPELRKPRPDYTMSDAVAGRLGMTDDERVAVEALRRRGMGGLIFHKAEADKAVRARTFIAPAAEAGNVHLPAYAEWTPHLLDEVASFPNGSHDDQVDAMSQALQRMGSGAATISRPRGTRPIPAAGPSATTPRAAPSGVPRAGAASVSSPSPRGLPARRR